MIQEKMSTYDAMLLRNGEYIITVLETLKPLPSDTPQNFRRHRQNLLARRYS